MAVPAVAVSGGNGGGDTFVKNYIAHRVISDFHLSLKLVRGIRGPVGSGKSVACCMEIISRGLAQAPGKDGVRRTRWAVVRNSYPELKSTTIKTWENWFRYPGTEHMLPGFGPIIYSAPIREDVRLTHPDGGKVEIEILFLALDRPEDIGKLKSLEVTGVWINEAVELPRAVITQCIRRVGRFPDQDSRPAHLTVSQWPTWYGVIMDTNSPDDDHWYYTAAEEEQPEEWEFFVQPGGLEADAENIENLPGGRAYYDRMMKGMPVDEIDVYVHNKYGSIYTGKAIYPEYNDNIHAADKDIPLLRGLPLRLGFDYGLTPAVIIAQVSPRGQLRFLDEICATDLGIENFAAMQVKPHLNNFYEGMKIISRGDPGGARAETDERTCSQILTAAGIPTKAAKTNQWSPRRESLAYFMNRMVGGEPAFLVGPKCKMLKKGLRGGYHFKRVQVIGEERFQSKPNKNAYSHPCEAAQYLAMELTHSILKGKQGKQRTRKRGHQAADSTAGY